MKKHLIEFWRQPQNVLVLIHYLPLFDMSRCAIHCLLLKLIAIWRQLQLTMCCQLHATASDEPMRHQLPVKAAECNLAPAAKCCLHCPLADAVSHAPSMHPLPAIESERKSAYCCNWSCTDSDACCRSVQVLRGFTSAIDASITCNRG